MKNLALALFLALLASMAWFAAGANPDTGTAAGRTRTSMKGWELYTWEEQGRSYYALLGGSNRMKTRDEIAQAAVEDFEAIKRQLEALMPGEVIHLSGRTLNEAAAAGPAGAAAAYARKIGLIVNGQVSGLNREVTNMANEKDEPKPHRVIRVADYGATPDAEADAGPAIRAAVGAASGPAAGRAETDERNANLELYQNGPAPGSGVKHITT